jgi:hypothetical protein
MKRQNLKVERMTQFAFARFQNSINCRMGFDTEGSGTSVMEDVNLSRKKSRIELGSSRSKMEVKDCASRQSSITPEPTAKV